MSRAAALTTALCVAPALAQGSPPAADAREDPAQLAAGLGADPEAAGRLFGHGAAAVRALRPFLSDPGRWNAEHADRARTAALRLLADLGPDAADALDPLVDCLENEAWRAEQDAILLAIGRIAPYVEARREEVRLALGNRCDTGGYFGRTPFFACLSRLGFAATATRDRLVAGLDDPNRFVRTLAAEALAGALRAEPPDAERRRDLLAALRAAEARGLPAEYSVQWKWNGKDANTRGSADDAEDWQAALGLLAAALDPADPAAVPGHLRQLQHTDHRVRIEALFALGRLGDGARAAVPVLAGLLADPDLRVAREAATALGMMGACAAAARDALRAATGSTDQQLATRAAAVLRRLPAEQAGGGRDRGP